MSGGRSFVRWLFVTMTVTAVGWAGGDDIRQRLLPFGVAMVPGDGSRAVDPRNPVTIEAVGWGARLAGVKIHDGNGKLQAEASNPEHFTLAAPLDFGTHYTVTVTVERSWTGRKETRELTFTTVERPNLEGFAERALAPDGSLTLRFDRPVGHLECTGTLKCEVETDQARQTTRLIPRDYPQGQTFPLHLAWSTSTGVPLPPLHLAVSAPPALSAEIFPRDLSNVGLAMPIQITFRDALLDRDTAGQHIAVRTEQGTTVSGRWSWVGRNRLQFNPQSVWPASSTIEVVLDQKALRSAQGGILERPVMTKFTTGADRRIFVYLDAQRMAAVENGQVVKTFKVSTGKAATPTVAGSFYIYARFPIKTMRSKAKPGEPGHYVVENVPYAQYFHADYAFHGAWWHNAFGRPASHGCVNMSTRSHNRRWPGVPEDAGWLYHWASLGVPVMVFRSMPTQQVAMK